MKDRKSIYIVCLVMLVTSISIGYAIVSGWLNINGTAKINAAKWEIYFKNVKIKDGSVTATVKPAISNKTTVNFEVELKKPGDFYEFNVDVVNDGDLDAMIESISITPELTIDQQKYLSYSVTYYDDVPLEVKDILHANKARTLKVNVEYLKNISNNELLSNEETINVHVEIKYVQADNTAKESASLETKIFNSITLISGDGTNLGDEVAIGNEHFYVISNDGENITMLSKYNLLVGNSFDGTTVTSLANPTGIQDESAKGYHFADGTTTTEYPAIGTVPFSSSQYWGRVSEGTYVYNDNASIKVYVDNYKDYLESLGATITEARLMKKPELKILGCNVSSAICSSAPSWVSSVSYWIGSTYTSNRIWYVDVSGRMGHNICNNNDGYGVRPVIVIPANSI